MIRSNASTTQLNDNNITFQPHPIHGALRRLAITLVGAACLTAQLTAAQIDLEGSVPAGWTASKGTLSISGNHYKMGSQSLRWDWTAGDVLTIANPGITAADIASGTCDLWVWNGAALPGQALRVQFLNATKPQYWFDMYCNFTGWRHGERCYAIDMGHTTSPSTTITSVQILAPASGAGSFYIDNVRWSVTGFKRVKDIQNIDITGTNSDSYKYNCSVKVPDIPLPSSVTDADIQYLNTIRQRWLYNKYTKWSWDPVTTTTSSLGQFNAMNIVSDANGIRGMPMYLLSNAPAEIRGLSNGGFMETKFGKFGWTVALALDWLRGVSSTATTSRDAMVLVAKHMLDQGIAGASNEVPGAWYSFDDFPDSLLIMASTNAFDATTKAQLWDFFRYNYCMGSFWDPTWTTGPSASNSGASDEIRQGAYRQLGAALFLAPNDAESIRWLKGFKRHMEQFLAISPGLADGIKIDGTGFHHSMHYPGYMSALSLLVDDCLMVLRETPYQINADSYQALRRYFMTLLTMSTRGGAKNPGYHPNALTGRSPFSTNLGADYIFGKDSFQSIATLDGDFSDPDHTHPEKNRIAQLYNQRYGVADFPSIASAGVGAPLDGFYQFNYSPIGIYRRENWVASMRGAAKGLSSTEIWSNANRYGRYLSYGALEIQHNGGALFHGDQITGWDWNHSPGTTTIVLPDALLAEPASAYSAYVTSQKDFSGSLAFHDGQSGISACDFQEVAKTNYNPTFVWKKSWFCFDNQIICLGSDIANNDAVHPTSTTLFQLHLAATDTPMNVDGTVVTNFPYAATALANQTHYFLDPFQTGYYVYPENNSITLSRATQTSASQDGSGTTTSDNFATVWLNHGTAPKGSGYEYVVFPTTSDAEMTTNAAHYGNPSTKPYAVVQRDANAHVVKWLADGRTGYALYAANPLTPDSRNTGVLANVSRPCLVMTQSTSATEAWMTVVDPSINLTSYTSTEPRMVEVTCNGHWALAETPTGTSRVSATATATTLRVTVHDGLPVHLHLVAEPITTPAIAGIAIPMAGSVPTATIAETDAYTAAITWSPSDSVFRASTTYTASITLTPKQGYTALGVPANFFTVNGATATNTADSTIITAVFPATANTTLAPSGPSGSQPAPGTPSDPPIQQPGSTDSGATGATGGGTTGSNGSTGGAGGSGGCGIGATSLGLLMMTLLGRGASRRRHATSVKP